MSFAVWLLPLTLCFLSLKLIVSKLFCCVAFQLQGMQSEADVLSKLSLWREASRIVNEEGVRAFWKGNMVTVAHRLPYSVLNFYAYEKYNKVSYFILL